ncbi:MAG: hypothetical protein FI695_04805 [SAR202 cluster bacterium]|nr:hypothetical protein [SAR202 cluster bacterium]|tara:strand:+ start:6 stop:596 length:591 start_codon:yes stop_codon:yes gene_type:complete
MNKGPITYSYWVVPEKVLAGEYPGNQMRKSGIFRVLRTLLDQSIAFIRHPLQGWPTEYKRVKKLLSAGVTNYLDLTQSEELLPYETLLKREAELLGMVVNYKRVPIKDQNITTIDEINKCISFINESIQSGNKVYIHCLRGLGRTGMIVGCFLVDQGLTGKQALKKITDLRKSLLNSVLPSPQNKKQSGVVENWKS